MNIIESIRNLFTNPVSITTEKRLRVREQQWDGCMAHILTRESWGTVIRDYKDKDHYGRSDDFYDIVWDDGHTTTMFKEAFYDIEGIPTRRM